MTTGNITGNLTVGGVLTYEDVTNVDSIGIVTARSGIHVTGGSVGVGTDNPLVKTHVVGPSGGGGKLYVDTTGTFSGIDTSTLGFSVFRGSSSVRSNSQAEIECEGDGNYSGSLIFKTQNPGTYPNSLIERLRIKSDGKVGIGTTNPDKVFVVKGTGGNYISEFHNTQDASSNNGVYIRVENTAAATQALNVNGQLIVNGAGEVTVGSAFSVSQAGVCTAAEFHGDGSNLTNLPAAGINTAAATVAGIVTTLDLSSAQDHKITVSGISTVTVKGGTEGESHTVRIINSGITTVGFSTFFLFPSGADPSMPTADGAISLISFTVNRVCLLYTSDAADE